MCEILYTTDEEVQGKCTVFNMQLCRQFQLKLSWCSSVLFVWAWHKRTHQVKGVLSVGHMHHAHPSPSRHCLPTRHSIKSLRHWNWEFVKSHLCLSWIKNGIVGSQSSYSKQFWKTGMAELSLTTLWAYTARRGHAHVRHCICMWGESGDGVCLRRHSSNVT